MSEFEGIGILNAGALLKDFVEPVVLQIDNTSEDDASERASSTLLLIALRENLDWLSIGVQLGYFALDEELLTHADRLTAIYFYRSQAHSYHPDSNLAWRLLAPRCPIYMARPASPAIQVGSTFEASPSNG